MFVVMVAPECAPAAQAGGLGEVVFGLSRELEISGNAVEIACGESPRLDAQVHARDQLRLHGLRPSLQAIGSLDRPNVVVPTVELARDNRHPVIGHIDELREESQGATDEERDILAILRSYQHPDQDTEAWTPGGGQ